MNATSETNNLDVLMDVKVQLSVQLGSCELSMKDVMELSPGAVVQLKQHAKDPVAYGEVVVVEDNFGIKITSLVGEKVKEDAKAS